VNEHLELPVSVKDGVGSLREGTDLYAMLSGSCHHGMAQPQVADGGDGLQIWRVAANILNKQSQTADRGWSFSLGVGRGANNPPL
jgi:hypothetical protein